MHSLAACLLTFWFGETSTGGRPSADRMMDDLAFVHGLTATVVALVFEAFEPPRPIRGPRTCVGFACQRPAARLEVIMTTPSRDRATRLIVALAMTSAMMAAVIAIPRAALADGPLDKMRAKVTAFIGDKMQTLGGSRIIYKVDSSGL